jgi:hypothetical protein
MLVVGTLHLVAPQMMMEAPAIQLTTVNHRHLIRAALGGAFIGIATLFLLGLLRASMRTFALISIAVLFSGFAFGRLVSIVLDGMPAGMFLAILTFELIFAGLAFSALREEQRGEDWRLSCRRSRPTLIHANATAQFLINGTHSQVPYWRLCESINVLDRFAYALGVSLSELLSPNARGKRRRRP